MPRCQRRAQPYCAGAGLHPFRGPWPDGGRRSRRSPSTRWRARWGWSYPGGPAVSQAAQTGDSKAYPLPTPHVEGPYNVSFSGLKTAVLNLVNKAQMKGERERGRYGRQLPVPHHGHSGRKSCCWPREDTGAKADLHRRRRGRQRPAAGDAAAGAKKLGARLYLPELRLCGDNAAMVAAQGLYEYRAGNTAGPKS